MMSDDDMGFKKTEHMKHRTVPGQASKRWPVTIALYT